MSFIQNVWSDLEKSDIQVITTENSYLCVVSNVPAEVLASFGARPSADTVMTNFCYQM